MPRSIFQRTLSVLTVSVLAITASGQAPSFQSMTLDGDIDIGYGLAIGKVDADDHVDVLLADKTEIVWYQNPGDRTSTWKRHVMARNLTERDNVCIAARDLDGDGLVEVAVGAQWNPGETTDTQASGALFYLERPADPTGMWKSSPITPHDPTTHRMHWIKFGSNDFRLAVLPLHGIGNQNGEGKPVRVTLYGCSEENKSGWTQTVMHESMHMTHNFDILPGHDADSPEGAIVAGSEGVHWIDSPMQIAQKIDAPPSQGAGEVRIVPIEAENAITTIEPMHGNEVVFYMHSNANGWQRQVLDASFNQGHALASADLLGQGRPQIVAGWRNPNSDGKVGIRMYVPNIQFTRWEQHTLDDNQMACEDLKLCDFDADGKLDIVAAGRATKNLVLYWNQTP